MSRKTLYFVSFAAAVVLFAASLSLGVAKFSWAELFSGSLNGSAQIMIASRLPRTFALVLTGASMAVAGMIMQILLKNRFVEPSMVGASQSAALGLVVVLILFPEAALLLKMSAAAACALYSIQQVWTDTCCPLCVHSKAA